jgi:hypothetical protein
MERWWEASLGSATSSILCESFQVWALGNVAMRAALHGLAGINARQRLMEYAENTRYWHHQIRCRGGPAVGFAESICEIGKSGKERWQVKSVTLSPIAADIDAAIKRIDRFAEPEADELARILIVPGMHLYTFWLEGTDTDNLFIVNTTDSIRPSLRRRYHWYTFLRTVSRHIKKTRVVGNRATVAADAAPDTPPSARGSTSPPRIHPSATKC